MSADKSACLKKRTLILKGSLNDFGDRKSIAVREICFRNDLMKTIQFSCSAVIAGGRSFLVDNELKTTTDLVQGMAEEYYKQEIEIDCDKTLLDTLGYCLKESLTNLFKQFGLSVYDIITYYKTDINDYTVTLEINHIRQGTATNKAFFTFYFRCADNDEDDYVFSGSSIYDMDRYIVPTCVDDDLNQKCILTYNFSNHIRHFKKLASVCSTINPYSIQNIIGNPKEYHDMLNKIYPYDRQNSFQLWFNDVEGNRMLNKNITGFLDLELIVDNSNNINLDV